jgi:hypothetical protein
MSGQCVPYDQLFGACYGTNDNQNGEANIPSCHIRDSADNEYQVQIFSGQQNTGYFNTTH